MIFTTVTNLAHTPHIGDTGKRASYTSIIIYHTQAMRTAGNSTITRRIPRVNWHVLLSY